MIVGQNVRHIYKTFFNSCGYHVTIKNGIELNEFVI